MKQFLANFVLDRFHALHAEQQLNSFRLQWDDNPLPYRRMARQRLLMLAYRETWYLWLADRIGLELVWSDCCGWEDFADWAAYVRCSAVEAALCASRN